MRKNEEVSNLAEQGVNEGGKKPVDEGERNLVNEEE